MCVYLYVCACVCVCTRVPIAYIVVLCTFSLISYHAQSRTIPAFPSRRFSAFPSPPSPLRTFARIEEVHQVLDRGIGQDNEVLGHADDERKQAALGKEPRLIPELLAIWLQTLDDS